ncbi:hypothetical protein WJX82_004453 [Trebouxia sp. C0006]
MLQQAPGLALSRYFSIMSLRDWARQSAPCKVQSSASLDIHQSTFAVQAMQTRGRRTSLISPSTSFHVRDEPPQVAAAGGIAGSTTSTESTSNSEVVQQKVDHLGSSLQDEPALQLLPTQALWRLPLPGLLHHHKVQLQEKNKQDKALLESLGVAVAGADTVEPGWQASTAANGVEPLHSRSAAQMQSDRTIIQGSLNSLEAPNMGSTMAMPDTNSDGVASQATMLGQNGVASEAENKMDGTRPSGATVNITVVQAGSGPAKVNNSASQQIAALAPTEELAPGILPDTKPTPMISIIPGDQTPLLAFNLDRIDGTVDISSVKHMARCMPVASMQYSPM